MSNQNPLPTSTVPDLRLLNGNPTIYAAANAGNPSANDKSFLDSMQNLLLKDQELNKAHDLGKSRATFYNMSPDIQGALRFINPNASYQQANPSYITQFKQGLINTLKAPMQMLTGLGNAAMKATHFAYNLDRNVLAQRSDKDAFNYVTTKKTWSDLWDGHDNWTPQTNDSLTKQHGEAMSALAKGLIDGKTPGTIIREHGALTQNMADAIQGYSDYSSRNDVRFKDKPMSPSGLAFKAAMDDYKEQQISPGRDITNWANRSHPPKDGGVWGAIIPMIFSLPSLGAAEVAQSKDGKKWLESNPNPFARDLYTSPSGSLDAVYSIAVDPTTWLTGGSSRSMMTANKLAETFKKTSDTLGVKQAVSDIFKVPAFAARQQAFIPALNALRDARDANDVIASEAIRTHIAQNFPEYGNDPLLKRLMTARPMDANEVTGHITDIGRLESYFKMGEDTNYIISGRMESGQYWRESQVMLERKSRKITDGMRQFMYEAYHGPSLTKIQNGVKPIPEEAKKTYAAFDAHFANAPEEHLGIVDPKDNDVLKKLGIQQGNYLRAFKNLMAKHPANTILYHQDGLVEKSLSAFRDYARLIVGDKRQANLLAERFLSIDETDRMNMLASMEKLYHDKIGMNSNFAGIKDSQAIIENRYGSRTGFRAVSNIENPAHLDHPNAFHTSDGAGQASDLTTGVAMPDFAGLQRITYDNSALSNSLMRYATLGGHTNDAFARVVNRGWAALQLIPKLGVRSAIDELTMGLSVQTPRAIYDYFVGKGRRLSDTVAAYSGDDKSMGLVKSRLRSLTGTNPVDYLSPATRKQMSEPVKLEKDFRLPNGKLIPSSEWVTADEFWGAPLNERIAYRCIAKYAGKLTPQEHQWMVDFLVHNPLSMEGVVRSKIGAAFADTEVEGSLAKEIHGVSNLTAAAEEFGVKALGKYVTDEYKMLSNSQRTLVHYSEFWRLLGKNVFTTKLGTSLDMGNLFFKYGGVATKKAGDALVNEAMHTIGWSKERGMWVTKSYDLDEDKHITSLMADASVKNYNGSFFRKTTDMRTAGLSEAEISEALIRHSLKELYTIVHGDSESFNTALVNLVKGKRDLAIAKIQRREDAAASMDHLRAYAKAESIKKTDAAIKKQAVINARMTTYTHAVRDTTYNQFEDVTKNNPLKGIVKTNYSFDELVPTERGVTGFFKTHGNIPYEMMDRQLTDLYRADAFHLKYLQQRKIMASNEKTYVRELIKQEVPYEDAVLQGQIYFANKATDNAANEIMKYADNPEVRTQLAWNLRVVGRFYRATEDYARRFTRSLYEHPDTVIYRVGHTSQAMSGSGLTYTDPNTGGVYILLPHDGTVVASVAPILAALSNPAGAIMAGVEGNWSFFKQPVFNQYTLKLSMLNPSYADGSGVPSFSGPSIAIPVESAKMILGAVGRHFANGKVLSLSENLDNWILGPGSDNTTWVRALVPTSVLNAWAAFSPEHQTTIAATSIMQAAAYLQSTNSTRMTPADWQDTDKVNKYYYRLRLLAMNLVVVKAGYNSTSPLPLGTTELGLPDELRRTGIISFTQQYSDILRAVLDGNAKYGYQLEDPHGTAVSLFVGSNPDKLVYTVNKTSNAAKLAISYTTQTKTWVMDNQKFIAAYPETAYIFAPHVGKYDPAVQAFLQAADVIPANGNLFTMNGDGLKKYMEQLSAVKLRAQYYDIDRNLNSLLTDPTNLERNNETYRAEKIKLAASLKADLKAQNFNLGDVLGTSAITSRNEYSDRFDQLSQMANNKDYASVAPEGQMRMLQYMTNQAKQMALVLADPNIRRQPGGLAAVQQVKEEGLANLEKYSQGNDVLSGAYDGFIKPYINNLLKDTTVAMSKP